MKKLASLALIILTFFTTILGASVVHAACSWEAMKGADFFSVDVNLDEVRTLNREQVQDDIDCLKTLINHIYSIPSPNKFPILNKLNKLANDVGSITNAELTKKIFSAHEGFIDAHLAYMGGGVQKQFIRNDSVPVELSEKFPEETFIDQGNYVYFKPGSLHDITSAQSDFLNYLRDNDRKLVLDLRGNGGGDDVFPFSLAETLFTTHQTIPTTTQYQNWSPLAAIGYCITLISERGDQRSREFCESQMALYKDMNFSELLPLTVQKSLRTLRGKRVTEYKSKIYLIIDSQCASACETIVEKLSVLPNVVVIGQPTYGGIHYSNPVRFLLPNSKILVSIPSLRQEYENDAEEGVGYKPDVLTNYLDLGALDNCDKFLVR